MNTVAPARNDWTIANCDNEPVQTPGCVQSHGVLLVLRRQDLRIRQVTDNAAAVLGQSAEQLQGHGIEAIIGADGQCALLELLHKETADCNPLHLMTLPGPQAGAPGLDVVVHTLDGTVVVEIEPACSAEAAMPDHYAQIKKAVSRLQTVDCLQQFCEVAAAELREITGLDRVMVYRFHTDGHGEVLAESRRADLPSWHGLHYPAQDIPVPVREIFMKTWIRPVVDIADTLANLVPLLNPDTGAPLNMTHCALRGVASVHTEYLRNMGVTATLTMAIRSSGRLWGLIACHHYAGPMHFTHHGRAACEFLAQVVSLQLHAVENNEHRTYRLKIDGVHRALIATTAREGGLVNLIDGTLSLLDGIDADGAALFYLDRWWCIGNTPTEDELDTLGHWLTSTVLAGSAHPLYATDRLTQVYPPAVAFASAVRGLLAVPVSPDGHDPLLWFRPETVHTVSWGGNPYDKPAAPGPDGPRLTPRRSFERYVESVRQRSLFWTQVEIDAATGLRLQVAEIVARRAGREVVLQSELARSNEELDAFAYIASHDLMEPLRGIHRYAHQLLEDAAPANDASRSKLDGLVRLTLRMDSLLDSMLHFSRIGGTALTLENVDLNEVLAETLDIVGSRTSDSDSEIVVPRALPTVRCDRMWCRQIFVNLISNGLKYTEAAKKRIEIGYIAPGDMHPRPNCPPGLETRCIYYVADNGIGIGIGIQIKHFDQIFKLFKRLHAPDRYGGGSGAGLTIVRKLVQQHGGRIWVDSLAERGSTFYFTLGEPAKPTT